MGLEASVACLRVASIASRYSEERVVYQELTVLPTGPDTRQTET
jgi:hypothetical protein